MPVKCSKCGHEVPLAAVNKDCNDHEHSEKVTLEDVIQQPLEAEPTNLEKQAVVSLMSRIMHHQGDATMVQLPTRGRVCFHNNNNNYLHTCTSHKQSFYTIVNKPSRTSQF